MADNEARQTVLLESPDQVKPYVHQFMPNLSPEAYDSLKEDIRQNGILMPILLDEGYAIVDGHNRVRIWQELRADGEADDPAPVAAHIIPGLNPHTAHNMAIAVNVKRRNMTPPQKRELVAQELRYLAKYYAAQGFDGDQTRSWSAERVAEHCAVSRGLVSDVRRELEDSGEIPVAQYTVGIRRSRNDNPHEFAQRRFDTTKVERLREAGQKENARRASRSNARHDGEAGEAGTLTLSDGNTVEVSEVEEIVNFYREQTGDEKAVVLANGTKAASLEKRHKGAIQTLAEMGIEVPKMPRGYTREEKVYALLADFRDRLLEMPADPKAVARTTEDYPVVAAASVEDFGQLVRWLGIFHAELERVVKKANAPVVWEEADNAGD